MKTEKLGPFQMGMNNIAPDYALPTNQNGDQAAARDALNVDFLDSGNYQLRIGSTLVQAMTSAHSLFSDGVRSVLVRGSVLYRITSFSTYAETLTKALSSNSAMSFVADNGEVWASNGTDFGRLSAANVWSDHALPTPASGSLASTTGSLPVGTYTVALTYAKSDGEEGGAKLINIDLTAAGGVVVTLPPAAGDATHINVYITTENGGVPLYKTQLAVGTASVTISTPASGRALRTANLSPLPAGKLAMHNGKLLSWSGKILCFSEPFNLGLYNALSNFIAFKGDISNVVPAQNGIYVVADKTYWFSGADIANPEIIVDVFPYGGISGTSFADTDKSTYGWFGANGLVVADANGQAKAVQEDNIAADSSATASILLRESNGLRQAIVCLQGTVTKNPLSRSSEAVQTYSINLNSGATSRYSNFSFSAMAKAEDGNYYALTSSGVFKLNGKTDAGSAIATSVDLGLQKFGVDSEKVLKNAYANVASDASISCSVYQAGVEYAHAARSSSTTLNVHRFDIGRGLRSNSFGIRLSSSGGSVELESFSVDVAGSHRRI